MRCARRFASVLVLAALTAFGTGASAQQPAAAAASAWPDKPVRIVLAFAAGGITDVLARLVAQKLSEKFNQQFVVDNRPGASGNIAAEIVTKSKPDGYTWLCANPSPFSINQFIYSKLAYKPEDLVGVALVAEVPNVLIVNKDLPVTTVAELIAYSKANPGKLNYSSGGIGSTGHLSSELFKVLTGVGATHVPYKGSAPALIDLLAGRVQMTVDNLPTYIGKINDGSLRPLAVASKQRVAALPNVPTAEEAGVAGFVSSAWYAFALPTGTPKAIVDKINAEVSAVVRMPDVVARIRQIGGTPLSGTTTDIRKLFADEAVKWSRVARGANVRAE